MVGSNIFHRRPSIFHSPQKHVQFSSVASNPTYSMPAQFSPLVAPMNGSPWKCNWMPTPNPQNGPHQFTSSPNQFTATQNPFSQTTPNPFDSSRLPFKRKAMPDMDLYVEHSFFSFEHFDFDGFLTNFQTDLQ